MKEMFGRYSQQVLCQYNAGANLGVRDLVTITCGLSDDGKKLSLLNKDDVLVIREQLQTECRVEKLHLELNEPNLTRSDIEVFSTCPVKEIKVIKLAMCSPQNLELIFGRNLSDAQCSAINNDITTPEDMDFLRSTSGHQCKSLVLDVHDKDYALIPFSITASDLNILQRCPLKVLKLSQTNCFSSQRVDLSSMGNLIGLWLSSCLNKQFVITGLPSSRILLDIQGVDESNLKIPPSKSDFVGSLQHLYVGSTSVCCPENMKSMFGRYTSDVSCQYNVGSKVGQNSFTPIRCGVTDDGTRLSLITKDDIQAIRDQPDAVCLIEKLYVELPEPILTDKDVEVLKTCPLREIQVSKLSMCSGQRLKRLFGEHIASLECSAFNNDITTRQDMDFLRSTPGHKCKSTSLYVENDIDFSLTENDIKILEKCPLIKLRLECFTSPQVDLSSLTGLNILFLKGCNNKPAIVTGLPSSLIVLGITGWDVHVKTDNWLGESMQRMLVTNISMCCPGGMQNMFGRNLPQVDCFLFSEKHRSIHTTCGLSEDRTILSISTADDVAILRQDMKDTCLLKHITIQLADFLLTQEDLDILARCPLLHLYLEDSRCFSPTVEDLSSLNRLTHLSITFCRNSNFIITGLPASLQWLRITGLAEFNIRISESGNGFGGHLTDLIVYNAGMCCTKTMRRMFQADLSSVCREVLGYDMSQRSLNEHAAANFTFCGLHSYAYHYEYLSVDTREQLHNIIKTFRNDCTVKTLGGVGSDFFLTQDDIDSLSICPLSFIIMPYTSCFYGSVDLSNLTNLVDLFIPHCTNLDFTITGLPERFRKLDIRGLKLNNIKVQNLDKSFGSSFRQIEVSNPTICTCPQASVEMFDRPLQENTTCGISKSIYSASNRGFDAAFISDGLNSAISSCEFLIENSVLRALMWMMAVFATCGNFAVLFYRSIWDVKNLVKSHGIFPFNLALSDLLMGMYLLLISWADTESRGEYVLFDEEWRLGPLCQLAGFINTLSSESSAMFILMITFDRFLAIQFPFGQYRLSPRHASAICGTVWIVSLLIASVPLTIPTWEMYSYNSICVGLPLNNDPYIGSNYSVIIFIGLNSVLFVLIAIGQALIYRANWANSKQVSLSEEQEKLRYKQDLAVARQLSLIVVTDFFCWFPICVMGLMVQTGHMVSDSAYAWSAVVFMPINSAINPLLYTLRHVLTDAINRCQKRRNPVKKEIKPRASALNSKTSNKTVSATKV